MLRAQCCSRHRRTIETIARLSSPVVVTALFSEPSGRRRRRRRDQEDDRRRGGRNDGRRRRRRGVCCAGHGGGGGCRDRCPWRRWRRCGAPTTGRAAPPPSPPHAARRCVFSSREELRARRCPLVSFVLFLPADDDPSDDDPLLLPLSDRWIAAT